jgi:hypothetical protein
MSACVVFHDDAGRDRVAVLVDAAGRREHATAAGADPVVLAGGDDAVR